MFTPNSEKTFIDKILARSDVDSIRKLVAKPKLKREELLELLYMLGGVESKLYNYSEWDRYIILKFFVWIREFVKIAELLYDYQDELKIKENTCKHCKKLIETEGLNKCKCEKPEPLSVLSARTRRLLDNNERLIEHNIKFLVDLFLNIGRTTLSIGATGFMELLKNRFEVDYRTQQSLTQTPEPRGFSLFRK
jgi:hypothetical protein